MSAAEALAGDIDRVAGDLEAVIAGRCPTGPQLEADIHYMSPRACVSCAPPW